MLSDTRRECLMHLWQRLVEGAESEKIGEDKAAGLQWTKIHIPELWLRMEDDHGKLFTEPDFDWDHEWIIWQRNLEALCWMAKYREQNVRIPMRLKFVDDDYILGSTYLYQPSDTLDSARLSVGFRNRRREQATFNHLRGFDDLHVFWAYVF